MSALKIGDVVPDFAAETHAGEPFRLADCRGQIVVLFFYPMNNTAVCTKEACAFRDAYEDFVKAGAVVVGISGDSLESHRNFASGNRLPFVLLSDRDGRLRKLLGVPKILGLVPSRITYVIDQQGVVRHVFSAMFVADKHVTEALAVVRQLSSAGNNTAANS